MEKIEHIAIAVKSISGSKELFTKLLNTPPYKMEMVESEGVNTLFFRAGTTKIELIEGLTADNTISKFINKRGEGIHHIAFGVTDIYKEIKRLKEEGFVILNETPKEGADNKLVTFLHPKTTNGILVELCMENPDNSRK